VAYLDNYKAKEVSFEHAGVPERLRHFATIQYDNHVLLTGGLNWHLENSDEPGTSEQLMRAHAATFEFNVKSGRSIEHKMTEHRAKHCLLIMPDPSNQYNKLILAIGGVTVRDRKNPYTKRTQ